MAAQDNSENNKKDIKDEKVYSSMNCRAPNLCVIV